MGYIDLVGEFVYKQPLLRSKVDGLGENDKFLKENGWQDNTKALFFQATVPTGWTLDTSTNDKMLRVVSGVGGGTGGSHPLGTALPLNHNHLIGTEVAHTHLATDHFHTLNVDSTSTNASPVNDYAVGQGDVKVELYTTSGGPLGDEDRMRDRTLDGILDEDPTSSEDNHVHTVTANLTDTVLAYVDIIVGSKNTSSGYTDLSTFFETNQKIDFDPFALLELNDNFNEDRITPFGSKMLFFMSSPPIGWTQAATQNNKALRIVSGTGGGSGGTHAMGTPLNTSHGHTISSHAGHNHTSGAHRHDMDVYNDGTQFQPSINVRARQFLVATGGVLRVTNGSAVSQSVIKGRTDKSGSGITTSTSFSHDHLTGAAGPTIDILYVDVIEATKDSAGAPYPFVDLTGSITYKKLVSKQRLNNLAQNDEYLKFHTIPALSEMFFYQATAPLKWSLKTGHNDKCLRIVSGTGGGSGGTDGVSQTIPFLHEHSLSVFVHSHTYTHNHGFDTVTEANAGSLTSDLVIKNTVGGSNNIVQVAIAAPGTHDILGNTFDNILTTTDQHTHNHGGSTQSTTSANINLAYADIIQCEKD